MNLVVSAAPCGPSIRDIRSQSFLGHLVRLHFVYLYVIATTFWFSKMLTLFRVFRTAPIVILSLL